MLPSTRSWEALLACPPCPPWHVPFFTVESTLSTQCSRSDPPYSRQRAALANFDSLPPHDLVLWTDGSFLFLLARTAPAFLPTALSVALRPLFPFPQAQYAQVFPLKPAPFCTLFAGLGNTNKSAISLLFSYYLTLVLSSPPCPLLHLSFYLKLCGRSGRNCLLSPSVLLDYNGSPDTRFSQGTTRPMSWPDGVRYLRPPQFVVVSLLLPVVSTLVLSRTGGVLSHRSSLTHRFPRFPPRNLCSLVMLAVSSLVFAATDTAFFSALISLGLAELRILPAAPVDARPRTSLISFCTVQLRTLCAAHSLATLCLFTTSGPDPGELPGFWGSMVFCHAPIPRKGSGKQQQQQQQQQQLFTLYTVAI